MKKIKVILKCTVFTLILVACVPKTVFAKPISNTLKASISVLSSSVTVGVGDGFEYQDINVAIERVKEGGTVRIKSGEYKIKSIVSKNVILESYDGDYVDIITSDPVPQDIKIKVSNKVTINQEGVSPINLAAGVIESTTSPTLTDKEIIITAQKGDTIKLKLNEKIINRLGFNESNVMLKINNSDGVTIQRMLNAKVETLTSVDGTIYNLGEAEETSNNMYVYLQFTKEGQYSLEFWVDDNR